jgi:hypothetical protein
MEHDTEVDPGPATPEPSGEPRVDAALRRLGDLDSLPVSDHPPVFERIHGQLVEVLGELHAGPDGADETGGEDNER